MRYKAIFTDEFLSYFRLDDNGKTLVLTDKHGHTRAVPLEVEVEPKRGKSKTGRWIIHHDWIAEGECGYECSECGRCYDYGMNYCGYCGAKMERTEE